MYKSMFPKNGDSFIYFLFFISSCLTNKHLSSSAVRHKQFQLLKIERDVVQDIGCSHQSQRSEILEGPPGKTPEHHHHAGQGSCSLHCGGRWAQVGCRGTAVSSRFHHSCSLGFRRFLPPLLPVPLEFYRSNDQTLKRSGKKYSVTPNACPLAAPAEAA